MINKFFDDYIEQINTLKKGKELSALWWILKYGNTMINETFFGQDKESINYWDIEEFVLHIDNKQKEALLLKDNIKASSLSENEKKFLINYIEWLIKRYKIFQYSIYFEAEKGWYISNLTQEEKQYFLEQINLLQTEIYGAPIHTQEREKKAILNFMNEIFYKNKDNISQNDKNEFINFLWLYYHQSIKSTISQREIIKFPIEREKAVWLVHRIIESLYDKKCVSIIQSKDINQYTYNPINNIHYFPLENITIKDINQKMKELGENNSYQVISNDKTTTMICWDKSIKLSWSSQIDLTRLSELLDHEISTHFVRQKNMEEFGLVKSDDYNETEEWIALINEQFATKKSLNDIENNPSIHHISTYIGELYNYQDTVKLLHIWYKLNGYSQENAIKTAIERAQRVKRFYPYDQPGANRKDVSYWRGSLDVFDFLKKSNIKDFKEMINKIYVGKISSNDIELIHHILQDNEITKTPTLPIMIGKIIYAKLIDQGKKMNLNTIIENDLRFHNEIMKVNYQTKKKIISILNFLK